MRKTFNEWLREWGYRWSGDEQFVKGFMAEHEASKLLAYYEDRGEVSRG